MKIKSIFFQALICIVILSLTVSCSKSSGSGASTPPTPRVSVEETIAFAIDPGPSVYPALGSKYEKHKPISILYNINHR